MKVKIKRHQIGVLANVHGKMFDLDFDQPKEAIQHLRDSKKIDAIIAENDKLTEVVKKKYKVAEDTKEDVLLKANQELTKLLLEDAEIELSEYSKNYIDRIKLTPREVMILQETGLYKLEDEA